MPEKQNEKLNSSCSKKLFRMEKNLLVHLHRSAKHVPQQSISLVVDFSIKKWNCWQNYWPNFSIISVFPAFHRIVCSRSLVTLCILNEASYFGLSVLIFCKDRNGLKAFYYVECKFSFISSSSGWIFHPAHVQTILSELIQSPLYFCAVVFNRFISVIIGFSMPSFIF